MAKNTIWLQNVYDSMWKKVLILKSVRNNTQTRNIMWNSILCYLNANLSWEIHNMLSFRRWCLEPQTDNQSCVIQKISAHQSSAGRRRRSARHRSNGRRTRGASVDAYTVEQNGRSRVAARRRQRCKTISDPERDRIRRSQLRSRSTCNTIWLLEQQYLNLTVIKWCHY